VLALPQLANATFARSLIIGSIPTLDDCLRALGGVPRVKLQGEDLPSATAELLMSSNRPGRFFNLALLLLVWPSASNPYFLPLLAAEHYTLCEARGRTCFRTRTDVSSPSLARAPLQAALPRLG